MSAIGRREALKAGAAAVAALGLTVSGALQANATESTFPDVPGMRGDRRANELWYTYEEAFNYKMSADVRAAYIAIDRSTAGVGLNLTDFYRKTRAEGTYPDAYVEVVATTRNAYVLLSGLQLNVLDQFYRHDQVGLTRAFLFMGEGVLYDPRMPDPNKVHMMNPFPDGSPTNAWHYWHAFVRALTLQGIDAYRWNNLAPLIGLGWATQSLAKPVMNQINRRLDPRDERCLVREWATKSGRQLDVAFDSFPYPSPQ